MSQIAYIRVSTLEQNIARQREAFKDLKIDKYFEEKVSGKNIKDRPELNKMMDYVREGDTVIVESISRFGRSLPDLIELMNRLDEKGVHFKSLKEGDIDTTTANFPSNVHLYIGILQEVIPEELRSRVYCMHLNNDSCIEQANALGFNVVETQKEKGISLVKSQNNKER